MKLWIFVLCLSLCLSAQSQYNNSILFVGKIPNDTLDQEHYRLNGIDADISLTNLGGRIFYFHETISDPGRWYQWRDSIAFTVSLSVGSADSYSSCRVQPSYFFVHYPPTRDVALVMTDTAEAVRYIRLELISHPSGAESYLIPKYLYERKSVPLDRFKVYSSTTPVWVLVREYVYVALFRLGDQERKVECQPKTSQPVDSVQVHF